MSLEKYLNGYHEIMGQLYDYVKKKADECFSREEIFKKEISTVEQFEERRDHIRKFFIDSIGGLDFAKTPLNCICTGILDREDYVVKKIVFQSQPGFYVTSNLYIPVGLKGKLPAVLFACGHFESAKGADEYQKVCIDLVRNGFVVLITDPIGQGERMQYYDKKAQRPLVNWGITEHSYAGMQCNLTGCGIARYFIWDLIRAVDFLHTLPEVDAGRIGITGNSGGGMQTAYMMLVEERISAAIPCTWITSKEEVLKSGLAVDGEQVIAGSISQGLNYDDFISCFVPKPVMIGAVDADFLKIEGTIQSYERARKIYGVFNCEEKVTLSVTPGEHSYNDDMRQNTVNWFIRHFKGLDGTFATRKDIKTEKREELLCTTCGQVLAEYSDAKPVHAFIADYMNNNRRHKAFDISHIKEKIIKVLNIPEDRGEIHPQIGSRRCNGPINYEDTRVQYRDIFFFSEENITVKGIYIERADRESKNCTILLLDEGTENYYLETDLVRSLMNTGDVLVFDPRGVGDVKNRPINNMPQYEINGTLYMLNTQLIMMNTSLAALRVYDILRACDLIKRLYPDKSISMAGKGTSAVYALLASALYDKVEAIYLENMIGSFEELVTSMYYQYDVRLQINAVLKEFDLPDILEVLETKNIVMLNTPETGPYVRQRAF